MMIQELKAKVYDLIVQIEIRQAEIKNMQEQIRQLSVEIAQLEQKNNENNENLSL